MPRSLSPAFYRRPTLTVLAEIIGKVLVHEIDGRRTSGVIVEAEAYIGEDDPACHAAPGPTRRNAPLYGPPGRSYVNLNYGIHYLVNAVTEEEGTPAAILIRGLSPLEGIGIMRRRRTQQRRRSARVWANGGVDEVDLCRGPGNLTVALGIDLRHNARDLTRGPLAIEDHGIPAPPLDWTPRIGIRVGIDREWRCTWRGHRAVSRGATGVAGASRQSSPHAPRGRRHS